MKSLQALFITAAIAVSSTVFAASAEYMEATKKIDAAMASSKVPPSTTDEVRKLRADSDRMMKEGKEAEAMKLLEEARKLLKMQ